MQNQCFATAVLTHTQIMDATFKRCIFVASCLCRTKRWPCFQL